MAEVSRLSRCSACNESKSITDFYWLSKDPAHKYYGWPWKKCKKCVAEQRSQQKEADPEAWRLRTVDAKLRHLYGIGLADYEDLLRSQGGGCAICGRAPDGSRSLHVDHCHETGRVRGLLCGPCNKGMGAFRDTQTNLRAAISYLRSHLSPPEDDRVS